MIRINEPHGEISKIKIPSLHSLVSFSPGSGQCAAVVHSVSDRVCFHDLPFSPNPRMLEMLGERGDAVFTAVNGEAIDVHRVVVMARVGDIDSWHFEYPVTVVRALVEYLYCDRFSSPSVPLPLLSELACKLKLWRLKALADHAAHGSAPSKGEGQWQRNALGKWELLQEEINHSTPDSMYQNDIGSLMDPESTAAKCADAFFVTGNVRIPVYKCILNGIPFFQSLLGGEWRESREHEIPIKDPPLAFWATMAYYYTGSRDHITPSLAPDIMHLASLWEIEELMQICEQLILEGELRTDLRHDAELLGCAKLVHAIASLEKIPERAG